MKCLVVCLTLLVGLALAKPSGDGDSRGCRYILDRCVEKCPVGTHAYTTGCGYLTPEATCENPEPVQDTRSEICDFSACYCNVPTVRDQKTGLCVEQEKCT